MVDVGGTPTLLEASRGGVSSAQGQMVLAAVAEEGRLPRALDPHDQSAGDPVKADPPGVTAVRCPISFTAQA